jgi:putative colanic acid biosynthesis UDP-glucose lipid carrier transferase
MIERNSKVNRFVNVTADYLLLNISLIIIYNLQHVSFYLWLFDSSYIDVVLILNLLWLLAANLIGLYQPNVQKESEIIIKNTIKTLLLYIVLVFYIVFIVKKIQSYHITKEYLLLEILLFSILLISWKIIYLKSVQHSTIIHGPSRQAVIIGGGKGGSELYNRFKNEAVKEYKILGFFDDQPLSFPLSNLYLGKISSCLSFAIENKIDEIFCALPLSQIAIIEKLMVEADRNLIRFRLVPEHYEYFGTNALLNKLNYVNFFTIKSEPMDNVINRSLKRAFDILFSLFIIVFVFSWLFPVIYFLIKMESPGPVFFTQERSGKNNTTFNCYKFRSMYINDNSDILQAKKGDARITRIGAFLRKTSIDEMPQFFNVLLGNMSVVGPRPHMLSHTKQYSDLINNFMVRHYIKPGITGWAQINGFRGETKELEDMEARVEADVWYMENWSFTLDLKIIFYTLFKTMIGDKYAY